MRKSIVSGIILFNIQYEWIFCSLLAFVHVFSELGKMLRNSQNICAYYTLNKKSDPNKPTFHCTTLDCITRVVWQVVL